jgi:hypothetical protein
MPGVLLACREVGALDGLVVGLEHLLDERGRVAHGPRELVPPRPGSRLRGVVPARAVLDVIGAEDAQRSTGGRHAVAGALERQPRVRCGLEAAAVVDDQVEGHLLAVPRTQLDRPARLFEGPAQERRGLDLQVVDRERDRG